MMFNIPGSATYNLDDAANKYANMNVKAPEFEYNTNRWLVRYTIYGIWTWVSCSNQELAMQKYQQILAEKRNTYLQNNK